MSGSKVKDTKQEYQYSMPFVSPSGHEFSFYDTPENERLVVRHTSGSHIEFKADGSIFIKAVKDIHTHSSVLSKQSESAKGAEVTTQRIDTDLNLEVGGKLRIRCDELDLEVGSTGRVYAGTDFMIQGNNVVTKATESISLEGTKSIYVDTKEMRERVVSRQTEAGTMEDGSQGGLNVMNVYGNTIIQNNDEDGGITIASKGYLNLVAGAERVDLIGKFTETPSSEAKGTFTQIIKASSGSMDVSQMPGDFVFESDAGASYTYAKSSGGSSESQKDGLKVEIQQGDHTYTNKMGDVTSTVELGDVEEIITVGDYDQQVTAGERTRQVGGNETINIGGIQTVTAERIYLN